VSSRGLVRGRGAEGQDAGGRGERDWGNLFSTQNFLDSALSTQHLKIRGRESDISRVLFSPMFKNTFEGSYLSGTLVTKRL